MFRARTAQRFKDRVVVTDGGVTATWMAAEVSGCVPRWSYPQVSRASSGQLDLRRVKDHPRFPSSAGRLPAAFKCCHAHEGS